MHVAVSDIVSAIVQDLSLVSVRDLEVLSAQQLQVTDVVKAIILYVCFRSHPKSYIDFISIY